MHPRGGLGAWPSPGPGQARAVLAFVRERGPVHPREVDAHFAHGRVTTTGAAPATPRRTLLDDLHYRGLLRVHGATAASASTRRAARAGGGPLAERRARLDALIDPVVQVRAAAGGEPALARAPAAATARRSGRRS